MKRVTVLVAFALAVFMAVFATTAVAAPIADGSTLYFDPGSGSGTNAPCTSGSCFGMYQGPGNVLWTDIAPGIDGGVVVGKDQQPGSTTGGTDMGELSDWWLFFFNYGTFATAPFCCEGSGTCVTTGASVNKFDNMSCVDAASCLGKTELGSWHVSWNGVAVPMGSALGCLSTSPENCVGVSSFTWGAEPAAIGYGSTFELVYSWAVPDGDASGFGNVPFYLILRGTAYIADPCADAATRCNDNNACTNDLCDPSSGDCYHTNKANGTTCNDGNGCTLSDTCTNGVCAGTLKVCNDNNPCTTDSCLATTGQCRYTPTSGQACDDNNACTLNDTCATGVCKGTAKNCSDNNVCTTDTCNTSTGVCTNTYGAPTCGLACDESTQPGLALLPAGTLLGITQGVGSGTNIPCSIGSCFSMEVSAGVVAWTDFGPGTDGGIVVGKSQASGGQETNPTPCGCNSPPGELSSSWAFFNAGGVFFTVPDGGTKNIYCNTTCSGADCLYKTGLKVFNIGWNVSLIPMGSEAGCTQANCSFDQKEGIFVNSWTIDPVTGGDWSMNYSQVVPSGNFMGVRFSAIMRGQVTMPGDESCVDNNPCTDDSRDPATGACIHTKAPEGTRCHDYNACTTMDKCLGGVCGGTPVICNDGNVCTDDSCVNGICVYTNNTAPADDGNLCTIGDICAGGIIMPGPLKNCDDMNVCTTDSCNPTTGACVHSNNTAACNDGNACTAGDACSGGACAGTVMSTDDGNVCTDDSCANGVISHTPNTAACNDGDACTVNDSCSGGICTGTAVQCEDNNTCTTDACIAGVCQNPELPDGTTCTTGTQTGTCQAAACVPYPACPKGSVKSVTLKGGKDGKADNQIMTEFTVMNGGCIVRSSASKVVVTPGTVLLFNCKKGIGPQPTAGTWKDAPLSPDNNQIIQCPAETGDVGHLILDNHSAPGGKDGDDMVVNVSAN